jgi:hypothetical protein
VIYKPTIEGFEGQDIQVNIGFFSGAKLFINGSPASKGKKRGEMILQQNDGKEVIATWKAQFLGIDVPQLVVDHKAITLVPPLKWYQWVWGGWPILLVTIGGALGAILGLIGFSINSRIFRAEISEGLKFVVTAVISFLCVAAYFVAALGIALLLNR